MYSWPVIVVAYESKTNKKASHYCEASQYYYLNSQY